MKKLISAVAALCGVVGVCVISLGGVAPAQAEVVVVRHGYPHGYHSMLVPRERFYRGVPVVRYWGPRYPGFGYYYDDAAAFAFLGLAAWQLHVYADLNEAQLRAHESAIAQATSAPLNSDIIWNDANASGSVKAVREGHTTDGRACREFQQRVTIAGREEEAYGTACQQPDGSWKVNDTQAH
jgi:surface antigen